MTWAELSCQPAQPERPHQHFVKDAAFLLTVRRFLLTVELFYLQLAILAFLLTVGAFLLTVGKCVS